MGAVLSRALRVSLTKEVTYEQMPKEDGKVKLITKDKSFHKEGTDPQVPSVGCTADAFKELQGSQCDRGEGKREGQEVEVTAEGPIV